MLEANAYKASSTLPRRWTAWLGDPRWLIEGRVGRTAGKPRALALNSLGCQKLSCCYERRLFRPKFSLDRAIIIRGTYSCVIAWSTKPS